MIPTPAAVGAEAVSFPLHTPGTAAGVAPTSAPGETPQRPSPGAEPGPSAGRGEGRPASPLSSDPPRAGHHDSTQWLISIETRLPVDLLRGSETFGVEGNAVIRTKDGGVIVTHNDTWHSLILALPQYQEVRSCRLVCDNPARNYPTAADVRKDESVSSIIHGSDCARSLFALAHNGGLIDPEFPECQRLAAGGSIPFVRPSDLVNGLWETRTPDDRKRAQLS